MINIENMKKNDYFYHFSEGKCKFLDYENDALIFLVNGEKRRFDRSFLEQLLTKIEYDRLVSQLENNTDEANNYYITLKKVDNDISNINTTINDLKIEQNNFKDDYDQKVPINLSKIQTRIQTIQKIRKKPYFSTIIFKEKKYYIGENEYQVNNDINIISWTSEIAEKYYNYELYKDCNGALSLVRDIYYFNDKYVGNYDRLKIENNKLFFVEKNIAENILINRYIYRDKSIISTITKEQFDIIKENFTKNLIVEGGPGTGKSKIIYHKIKKMIQNNKIKMEDIYVITPNNLLVFDNDELTKEMLNINDINRFSKNNLFYYMLQKFREQNNIKYYFDEIIDENSFPNTKYYDKKLINKIMKKYYLIMNEQNSNEYENFVNYTIKKINELYNSLTENKVTDYNDIDILNLNLYNLNEKIKIFAKKIPKRNLDYLINNNRRLKDEKIQKLIFIYNNYELDDLEKNIKYNSSNDSLNTDLSNLGIKKILDEIENKTTFENIKKIHLLTQYKNKFDDFLKEDKLQFFDYVVEYLLIDFNDMDNNTKIFIKIVLLFAVEKVNLNINNKYIFIDEFQDFNKNELNTIFRMFSNSYFYLFGDTEQNIKDSGINSVSQINKIVFDYKKLNNNYRNPKTVVDYVNKKLNKDMKDFGIDGKVTEINLKNFKLTELKEDSVLIVKNLTYIDKIIDKINVEYNIVENDDYELIKGVLNIIPIYLTNGLEFNNVYVYNYNMSDKEKYLAYTRTLNELIVVLE